MDIRFENWYNQQSENKRKQLLKEFWTGNSVTIKTDLSSPISNRTRRSTITEAKRIYTGPRPGKRVCPHCGKPLN